MESILSRVPSHQKTLTRSVEFLSDEIREDYLLSAKKAIGILLYRVLLVCEGDGASPTQHLTSATRLTRLSHAIYIAIMRETYHDK